MQLFRTNRNKFFIIRDKSLFGKMLRYSMEELYPSCIETYSSVESLLVEKDATPDFILMNQGYSESRSVEDLKELRTRYPQARIIVFPSQAEAFGLKDVPNCSALPRSAFSLKNLSLVIEGSC